MPLTFVWFLCAAVLLILAAAIGRVQDLGSFGILFDTRGRYSLGRLQLVLWSIVVISLVAAVATMRTLVAIDPLEFVIPQQLLVVMGISLGSTVVAEATKSAKDDAHPERIAASIFRAESPEQRPRWVQIFLVEEGAGADRFVDVTKFQNLLVTLVLVAAYVVTTLSNLGAAPASAIVALPGFDATMLMLLGASHAGYLAGKLPLRAGVPLRALARQHGGGR